MDQNKPLKVRLTFSVILVGVSLLFAAVVTDHWAVLSPKVEEYNATCEAAHFGLWRLCTKRIFIQEQGPKEKGCGPISLPGVTVCLGWPGLQQSFSSCERRFLQTLKPMRISLQFLRAKTQMRRLIKDDKLTAGYSTPCSSLPAGLCIIISVEVMRQSVKRMIDSEETVWIEYSYSWSFACACASFVLLFICGIALLLIALPRFPQNPWETCMDAEPEH
ncbi:CCG1 protein, partial [Columbina picui]|nr:CCG1 protein [Columbina picui]